MELLSHWNVISDISAAISAFLYDIMYIRLFSIIKLDNFMHLLYHSKSACASRGKHLAGGLVFSPGTCYPIISPHRCSSRGQQSAPVVLLFRSSPTYGAKNRCQMLPPPSGLIITLSLLQPVCSLRTRADGNEAEPSPSDIAWILCILWWASYLLTRFARLAERGSAVACVWLSGATYFFKLN